VAASSSFPAEGEVALCERFLILCHPGKYFPLTISLHKESYTADTSLGYSNNIVFNGGCMSSSVILKDGNMDVAEVTYEMSWFDEKRAELDLESSNTHEADAVEEMSLTGYGEILPDIPIHACIVSRRLNRNLSIEMENVAGYVHYDDLALLIMTSEKIKHLVSAADVANTLDEQINTFEFAQGGDYEGPTIIRCEDFVWESPIMTEVLGTYNSIGELLANGRSAPNLEKLWIFLFDNGIISTHNTLDLSDMDSSQLYRLQVLLVIGFQNYQFAKDSWGLVIIPCGSHLPLISNIRVNSGRQYLQMEAPVGIGSLIFTDTQSVITSMDPWLRNQRLSG
jgi:hypothetical protein